MQSKIIFITSETSTGNKAYTGVGFQPKVVIIIGDRTATGDTATADLSIGAGTSSSNRVMGWGISSDAASGGNAESRRSTTLIATHSTVGGSAQVNADLVSLDADGFTLNWSTVNATTRKYAVMCIGGADVQAKVGQDTAPATNTTKAVTGVGFQPNTLIFFDCRLGTTATGFTTYWRPAFGFCDSAGNQFAWSGDTYDAASPTDTHYVQTTSGCLVGTGATNGAINRKAAFSSYDSDGFTLSWSSLDATVGVSSNYFWIALNVPFSNVGNVAQRTSNGTTDVTFTQNPVALLLGGASATDTNGGGQGHRFSIGGKTASEQFVHSHADTDNVGTSVTSVRYNESGHAVDFMTAGGASPTTLAEADISAFSLGKFTLNWTTTDATARLVGYLVMGNSPHVPRMGFTNFQNPGIA